MWDYTEKVKDHFLNPRNVGEIVNPDAVGEIGNIRCGDALRLSLKIDDNKRIVDAKFKTFGCASAIASSSALTELIKGLTLDEALKISNNDIAEYLGGLPEEKMHCSVMGQEALEKAINSYRGIKTDETEEDKQGNIVCKCFGVTDSKIKRVVMENNLKTVDEVTNYCKAGGACGSCHDEIEKIIRDVHKIKSEKDQEQEEIRQGKKKLTNIRKIQLIQETIDHAIKPALRHADGDLELVDVDGDKVYIRLKGACSSCRSAGMTLKGYIEKTLRDSVIDTLEVIQEKS